MLFQHLVIFITISTAMTILNQICLHLLPISNLYSHPFIMCSFNHLSFNNYFHSKGNSKSNSPFYQNFHVFPSFSKLQPKDLLGAPYSFLFSLKMQSQDFCTSTSASSNSSTPLLSCLPQPCCSSTSSFSSKFEHTL